MTSVQEALNDSYGSLADFKPDVLASLTKHLNLDNELARNFVYSSINSKEDNEVRRLVAKAVESDLQRIVKDPIRSRTVNITQYLDPSQQRTLQNSFQSFRCNFVPSDNNSHGFAAAHRKLEYEVLLLKIGYDKNKDYTKFLNTKNFDAYFVDVGANFPSVFDKNLNFVHCCSPVLSAQDANRFTNRYNRLITQLANENYIDHAKNEKAQQIEEILTGKEKSTKFMCLNKAQNCPVKAPFCVALHSIYDLTNADIANIMLTKGSNTMIGTFIYSDQMLIYDHGYIEHLDVFWEISKTDNTIRFIFSNDSSNPYVHDLDKFFKLIAVPAFYSKDKSTVFFIELLENVNGVQFFKINKQLHSFPNEGQYFHQISLPYLDDKYKIKFFIRNKDHLSKYFDSFCSIFSTYDSQTTSHFIETLDVNNVNFFQTFQDMTRAANIKLVNFDTSKFEIEFYCEKEMVEALLSFALSCTETKFKPIEVFSYARSYAAKIFVGKTVIRRYKSVQAIKLFNLAHAVYMYVYDYKFNQGKVMQDLINDLDWNRRLEKMGFWSKIFTSKPNTSIRDQERLGVFRKFDLWLYNRKCAKIATTTFITEARTYALKTKFLPSYFNDLDNVPTKLYIPDCLLNVFPEEVIEYISRENSYLYSLSKPKDSHVHKQVFGISNSAMVKYDPKSNYDTATQASKCIAELSVFVFDISKLDDMRGNDRLFFQYVTSVCKESFLHFNADDNTVYICFRNPYFNKRRVDKFNIYNYEKHWRNFHIEMYNEACRLYNLENIYYTVFTNRFVMHRRMLKINGEIKLAYLPLPTNKYPMLSTLLIEKLKNLLQSFDDQTLRRYQLPIPDQANHLRTIIVNDINIGFDWRVLLVTRYNEIFRSAFEKENVSVEYISSDFNTANVDDAIIDYARTLKNFKFLNENSLQLLKTRLNSKRYNYVVLDINATNANELVAYYEHIRLFLKCLKTEGTLHLNYYYQEDNALLPLLLFALYVNFKEFRVCFTKHENLYNGMITFQFHGFEPMEDFDGLFDNDTSNYKIFVNNSLYEKFSTTLLDIMINLDTFKTKILANLVDQVTTIKLNEFVENTDTSFVRPSQPADGETNTVDVIPNESSIGDDSKVTPTTLPENNDTEADNVDDASGILVSDDNDSDGGVSDAETNTTISNDSAIEETHMIIYTTEDILTTQNYIVHCISSDIKCSAGFAAKLSKINDYARLLRNKYTALNVGEAYVEGRVISLVTKSRFFDKPTKQTMLESLRSLRKILERNEIRKISMPRIGTGCDKMLWTDVLNLINHVFRNYGLEIYVHSLYISLDVDSKRSSDNTSDLHNGSGQPDLSEDDVSLSRVSIASEPGKISSSHSISSYASADDNCLKSSRLSVENEVAPKIISDQQPSKIDIIINGKSLTFEYDKQYEKLLRPAKSYNTLYTRGDGRCLFYALTRGLVDVDQMCDYFLKNLIKPTDSLINELMQRFGGTESIQAFATLTKSLVFVFDMSLMAIYVMKPERDSACDTIQDLETLPVVEVAFLNAHYSAVIRTCRSCTKLPISLGYFPFPYEIYTSLNFSKFNDHCIMCVPFKANNSVVPYSLFDKSIHILRQTFDDVNLAKGVPMFALLDCKERTDPDSDSLDKSNNLFLNPTPVQALYLYVDRIPGVDDKLTITGNRIDCVVSIDKFGRVTNMNDVYEIFDRYIKSDKLILHTPLRVDISPIFSKFDNKPSFTYEVCSYGVPANPVDRVILPHTSKINVLKNAMNEIRFVWFVTHDEIRKNLQETFTEFMRRYNSGEKKKFTMDTSVGIIDLFNKQMLRKPSTEYVDINYVYGVQSGKFHPVEPKFFNDYVSDISEQYVIFNKSTKIMNEQGLYDVVSLINYDPKRFNFKIRFVEGVPGAGKTSYIVNHLSDAVDCSEIVLTATNESANEVRKRFIKKYDIVLTSQLEKTLRFKFRNMDSALMTVKKYSEVKKLFIDEALMRHIGQIYWLAYLMRVEEVVVCGDSCQIPYFNNEGIVTHFAVHKPEYYNVETTYLTVSHRIPCDVAYSLNDVGTYHKTITTTNTTVRSMEYMKIDNANSIPTETAAVYLVFSRAEKAELLTNFDCYNSTNLFTVGEFQGRQNEIIILVRINEKNNPLYESINQLVVAISRHTKRFVYCSVVQDAIANRILALKDLTDIDFAKFLHENLVGGGSFSSYVRSTYNFNRYFPRFPLLRQKPDFETLYKPDFAIDLNSVDGVVADLVLNHGGSGYIPLKFAFKEENYEVYDVAEATIKVPPPTVSNPINIIQTTLDEVFPGSTLYSNRYDCDIFDTDPLILHSEGFSFVDDYRPLTKPDTLSPTLRTSMSAYIPTGNKTVMKAFNERNGCVPQLHGRIEAYSVADALCENFFSAYMISPDITRVFRNHPIDVNVDSITEWFETQNPTIVKTIAADMDFSIYDKTLSRYQYILKRLAKPVLDANPHTKFSSPQAIAFQEKQINAIFCSIAKEIKHRLVTNMRKNFVINCDMSVADFTNILNHRIPPHKFVEYTRRIEFDISKYDKSQGLETLLFEIELMERVGVPEEYIATWAYMHVRSKLYSLETKFSAEVSYQRKSGDAMTYLGNTTYFMAILSSMMKLDNTFCLFSGDDSYILASDYVDPYEMMSIMANTYNFEVKVFEFNFPYFCSKFIVPVTEYNWIVVPDLIKLSIKFGRSDLVSEQHVEDYRISCQDLTLHLDDYVHYDSILIAHQERYKNFNISIAFIQAIFTLVNDHRLFHNLYYLKPGDRLKTYTVLPSLDI